MVTLANIHLYTVVCNSGDYVVGHYINKDKGLWCQSLLGTKQNPPMFQSTQYVVFCPINMFYPLALLKGNIVAQATLLLEVINQYKQEN